MKIFITFDRNRLKSRIFLVFLYHYTVFIVKVKHAMQGLNHKKEAVIYAKHKRSAFSMNCIEAFWEIGY